MALSEQQIKVQPPGAQESPLVDRLVMTQQGGCGAVLAVLEQLQHETPHQYLPESQVRRVARLMGVPLSQLYSVVTFYSFFNLQPQGDHSVAVCRGTACHTRGSRNLLGAVRSAM